jgi:hypothetical protein
MEERSYNVVRTDEDGTSELVFSYVEEVEPLGDVPLAVGESVPMAAFAGDGIRVALALQRTEHSYFASPEIDLLTSDGQWQRQTGKKCHMSTRDPFTRPPTGSLNDRPELPFPPWEAFGYWTGGSGDDRWLCLAGFVEEHVARLTIEVEEGGEIDAPITTASGAWAVAVRGRRVRDYFARFFDSSGELITAWGERKWHYARAEFASRRGVVELKERYLVRDHLLDIPMPGFPVGFSDYRPTRRDVRRYRAFCRGEGVFVQMVSRISLRWPDGSEEEVYGDTSQMRWIPWARPDDLVRIDWDDVYDWEMTDDETELRMIGAKAAAEKVRGPRPVAYSDELRRLLLAHRLIAALQQRPRC